MSAFTVGYDFQPKDQVWVVDKTTQSVHHGICIQVDIKIYPDSAYVPVPTPVYGITPTPSPVAPIIDHLVYWVIQDNAVGSVKVVLGDIFGTLAEALAALGADITPTPTPTASVTPTPSQTQTPTPTVTPTPTPSGH
jgi:hypothetical protein